VDRARDAKILKVGSDMRAAAIAAPETRSGPEFNLTCNLECKSRGNET